MLGYAGYSSSDQIIVVMKKSKVLLFFAVFLLSFSMVIISDDAEAARRFGGGHSFGRQSSKIGSTSPFMRNGVTNSVIGTSAATRESVRTNTVKKAQPRSTFSRFLSPIAGIATGLGIAALLSSLGFSGAFLEFLSSAILIGLVVLGVLFVFRRLRGVPIRAVATSTSVQSQFKMNNAFHKKESSAWNYSASNPSIQTTNTLDNHWFIPDDFNTHAFLQEAKKQFVLIQSLWDTGDIDQLHQYLTDDLMKEITPHIINQSGQHKTEVILLNAELLGIEKVVEFGVEGHLVSVHFSGMLREQENQSSYHFEEVWNLYKVNGSGWLLAGIQQLPTGI